MRLFLLSIYLVTSIGCGNKRDADKLRFLEQGNTAYANNDIAEAIRFYDEALVKDSTFVDAWNNKGLALMKISKFDEAIFCFDHAIMLKPDYEQALLNHVRANLEVHQHYSALSGLDELEVFWPDSSIIHFTRGLIFADMAEPASALDEFTLALDEDSLNAEIWVNMGNIYFHQQMADSAILFIKTAIRLDARQPHAYNVLAMIYAYKNDFDAGLKAINTALSYKGNDAYFLNNKGYIFIKLNRLAEAEESIVRSMKIDPYNGWVYRNLGLLHVARGNYIEAARLVEKALKMDDKIDHIYLDLANIYLNLELKSKACELLSSAPENVEINTMRIENCQ